MIEIKEQKERNVLILRELPIESNYHTYLDSGRKVRAHWELEYQWLNATGGVQGNEFAYFARREVPIKAIQAGKVSLFDCFSLIS